MIYTENDIIPYYLRIPSHLMNSSTNMTAMEPYVWEISDLIQMSVVPNPKGDDIQSCMTYNPPGPFEIGYDVDRSVSTERGGHSFVIFCYVFFLKFPLPMAMAMVAGVVYQPNSVEHFKMT